MLLNQMMHVCDALADLILALRTAKLDNQFSDEINKAREALMGVDYGGAKTAQHEGIIKPTIHLNGTSKDDLLDNLTDAVNSMRNAIHDTAQTVPHGRDYFTVGGPAYSRAQKEHHSRMEHLKSVRAELEELLEHVANS